MTKIYDQNIKSLRELKPDEIDAATKLYVQMSEAATLHRIDTGNLLIDIEMTNGKPSKISTQSVEAAIAESKKQKSEW